MRRMTGWVLGALILALTLAPAAESQAQDSRFPVAPEDCTIEPAPMPQPGETGNLATPAPAPSPLVADSGTPAEDETIEVVSDRIAMAIACQNAGDVLRMLANFSERWIADRFRGYDLVFYGRFQEAALDPEPLPTDERIALGAIEEVREQVDGRVTAMVTTRVQGAEQVSLVVLVEEEPGDWVIDGGQLHAV